MPNPSVRASATVVAGLTCNKPTGTASGDVLVGHVYMFRADLGVATGPSGWTKEDQVIHGDLDRALQTWTKLAGGSEPASYTWAVADAGNTVIGIICVQDTAGTSDGVAAGVARSGTSTLASNSLTTTVNGALLIWSAIVQSGTITVPGTSTETYDPDGGDVKAGTETQASFGAVSKSGSQSGTADACVGLIAIKAGAGGGGTASKASSTMTLVGIQ